MAPNNALGNPTAAELRAKAEAERVSDADGFGAGALSPSEVVKASDIKWLRQRRVIPGGTEVRRARA